MATMEGTVCNPTGKKFHNKGIATEKPLLLIPVSPTSARGGICSRAPSADFRGWVGGYGRKWLLKYLGSDTAQGFKGQNKHLKLGPETDQ